MRRTARGAFGALAVLVLGFVVALAANSVPGRVDEPILDVGWQPGIAMESVLTWLIVIAAVIGALILVFTAHQGPPRQGHRRNYLVGLIIGVLVFALVARFMRSIADTLAPETSEVTAEVAEGPIQQVAGNGIWMLSLLVAAVVAIALAKVGLAIRSGAPPVEEAPLPEAIASASVDVVASTSYGEDPRGRVFGAYARFEHALEEVGVARSPAETAFRHIGRASAALDLNASDVRVLSTSPRRRQIRPSRSNDR